MFGAALRSDKGLGPAIGADGVVRGSLAACGRVRRRWPPGDRAAGYCQMLCFESAVLRRILQDSIDERFSV
jgi:hypothetical protein